MRCLLEERVSEVSFRVTVGTTVGGTREFERSSLHRARCAVVMQVSPWETFLRL